MTIEIKALTKTFGKKEAVKGISLEVPQGSFFGFLGPNGAGKTTTIRMITGLLAPTSGDAILAGQSIVTNSLSAKQGIGVVPDDLALFDRLSMLEHLTMVGRIYGLSKEDTLSRSEDLLTVMGLWDERGTFAGDSSHGMRKKLALAMALIHKPAILFLDEPFEGIDPLASKVLRSLLQRMSQSGTTIFLTSHILEIIEKLVDHVAIIVEGEIALNSSMAELKAEGRNLEQAFVLAAGGSAPESEVELPWL